MTSALEPISPKTSACPMGVDLLRSSVPFSTVPTPPAPLLPEHDASDPTPVRTLAKTPSTHSGEYDSYRAHMRSSFGAARFVSPSCGYTQRTLQAIELLALGA